MNKFILLLSLLSVTMPVYANINHIAVLEDNGIYRNPYSLNVPVNNRISQHNYNRLSELENSIFGQNYENQDIITRIERLEYNIFNRLYPNSTINQRINNLIYRYNRTINSNNYSNNKLGNIISRFNRVFYGVPTGYTPPIYSNGNYGNYNDYYDNKGYYYYNNKSIGTGSGVHIID